MNNINSSEFLYFNILIIMADAHVAFKIININWNGLKLYIF